MEKVRGTLRKGFQWILEDFKSNLPELDRGRVFVTNTCEKEEEVRFLMDEVKRVAAPKDVRVTKAGSVISSHCGPRSAGIQYFVR